MNISIAVWLSMGLNAWTFSIDVCSWLQYVCSSVAYFLIVILGLQSIQRMHEKKARELHPSNPPHPLPIHLHLSKPLRLLKPRENPIHPLIHPLQLRTPQPLQIPRHIRNKRLHRRRHIDVQPRHRRRRLRLHELENETLQIVALA